MNYPPSAWLADAGWSLPTLVDSADDSVLRAFGLTAYPFVVVVGPDGLVAARASGAIPIETLIGFTESLG